MREREQYGLARDAFRAAVPCLLPPYIAAARAGCGDPVFELLTTGPGAARPPAAHTM